MGIFLALLTLVLSPCPAQSGGHEQDSNTALLADLIAFERWLETYEVGAFRLVREGRSDPESLNQLEELMVSMAQWNNLAAARALFEAAIVDPQPPGDSTASARADFYRELQPWKVRELARRYLATMTSATIRPWLLAMLGSRNLRDPDDDFKKRVAAAMHILGESTDSQARMELLEASTKMPAELRVRAVMALARNPDLETAEHLLAMLRDREPNVRIAAATALGNALGPLTDESVHAQIDPRIIERRDEVIERLQSLLEQDRLWQVRKAAAESLAALRCKAAIPALIAGLKAELQMVREPWALDLRLHQLLEGMTGQNIPAGSHRLWERFWREKGPTFAYGTAQQDTAEPRAASDRYQKFFRLSVESDRVLFVLDFSGSMAEPADLSRSGTSASRTTSTKAKLVVEELKTIILALPDGTLFNIIVFSDEARAWRSQRDGLPSLEELDDAARDDLLGHFLDSMHPQGSTNLYAALNLALDFGGRGLYDKYYELGFDTLYVLSDGAPSSGEVTDPDEIRRRVRQANLLKRLTIHTITFGNKNDTVFLRLLAEENGGRHIHIE